MKHTLYIMYKAARHTLATRAVRRTLLLLTLAAAITATLLLLNACTAQQLEPDPTAPIDPATLPADGRLAISRLDIATGATTPATRISQGAATWEAGDGIRVTATAKATGKDIVGYYTYQEGGTWLQEDMKESSGQNFEVVPADTYPLYIDDIDRTQPIRINCWGGNIYDQDLYYPADHIYTDQDAGIDGNFYHLNDHLAADATLHTMSTPGGATRGSLTATLTHQRVDVVVRLITDAAHPIDMDADGNLDHKSTLLHLALKDRNSTGQKDATIRSWMVGMTAAAPDAPDAERGKSVVTFRAYVKPADLPAAGTDGFTRLGTLTYATRVDNDNDGIAPITLPGSGKLGLKYKLSSSSSPIKPGTRLTITIDFTRLTGLALSATVSPWTIEEGGEVITQPKTDGTKPLDPDKFNAEHPLWIISGGGDTEADALVAKNVKKALDKLPPGTSNIKLMLTEVKSVPKAAFQDCTQLAAIDLSGATSIGQQAFLNCTALARIDLPEAKTISAEAFVGCTALTTVHAEAATSIGESAFDNCTALTAIDMPRAETISAYAFADCPVLATINLPAAKSIGNLTFANCYALTRIDLKAATSIGINAFDNCTALATVSLPAATNIGSSAFVFCRALTSLSLTAPGKFTLGAGSLGSTTTCALTLNADKAKGGEGFPLVTGDRGREWAEMQWKSITHTPAAPANARRR